MLFLPSLNSLLSPYIKKIDSEIESIIHHDFINQIAQGVAFGGKRIRPIVLILTSKILGGKNEMEFLHSATAIELIHLASLLHDDVIDQGTMRHKKQTAHILFGNQQVILGGDFLFAESFKKIVQTKNLEVIEIVAGVSSVLATGELEQLQTKINHNTTLETYFEVIYKKTASLFEASTGIASIIQGKKAQEVFDFGRNIGMIFQIVDDLIDYNSNKTGKTEGADFFESKITLPIIIASGNNAMKERLEELFTKQEKTEKDFIEVKTILEKSGAFNECKEIIYTYSNKATLFLNSIEKSKEVSLMLEIIDFFIKRVV